MKCGICKKDKGQIDFKLKKNGLPSKTCITCLDKEKKRYQISIPSNNEISFNDNEENENVINDEESDIEEIEIPEQLTSGVGLEDDLLFNVEDAMKEIKKKKTKKEKVIKVEVEEDHIKRLELIAKFNAYKTSFPKELSKYKYLDSTKNDKLEKILDEMRIVVSCKNTHGLVKFGYFSAVKGVETIGSRYLGLKLQGLSETLKANDEIDSILKEIEIERISMKYQKPEVRLAFITITSCLAIHTTNKKGEILKTFMDDKPNDVIIDKFKDI